MDGVDEITVRLAPSDTSRGFLGRRPSGFGVYRSVPFRSRERASRGRRREFRIGCVAEFFDVEVASVQARLNRPGLVAGSRGGWPAECISAFSPCSDASIRHCQGRRTALLHVGC